MDLFCLRAYVKPVVVDMEQPFPAIIIQSMQVARAELDFDAAKC